MRVNQQAIADLLDLDRTTVTKILNRDPKYSASEATKERVFRAAELLGYDFTTIRRPFKREYGRMEVNSPCRMTLTLEDGTVFDEGEALVRNLSVGGALVTKIRLGRQVLPLQNFTLLLKFTDIPTLEGIVGECEIVRLAGSTDDGEPELGVRFINATHRDRRRIQQFVEDQIQSQQRRAPAAEPAPAVGAHDQDSGPAPAVGAHDQGSGPAPAVGAHDQDSGPAPAEQEPS